MSSSHSKKPHPRDRESLLALDKDALVDRLLSLEAKLDQLSDYVREMVTQKYGRKNDRFESPGQLLVFPGAAADSGMPKPQVESSVPASSTTVEEKPKKPGHGRKPIPAHLPRVPVTAKAPSDEARRCPSCDALRVAVRKILRSSRYGCVPMSFFVEDLYAVVYECPNGHGEQLVAEVNEVVQHGKAAPSLMAQVSVSRDFDHIAV